MHADITKTQASQYLRYGVFPDANWDFTTFDFDSAMASARKQCTPQQRGIVTGEATNGENARWEIKTAEAGRQKPTGGRRDAAKCYFTLFARVRVSLKPLRPPFLAVRARQRAQLHWKDSDTTCPHFKHTFSE